MSGKQIFEGAQIINESSQRRLQNISESSQQRLQNISESSSAMTFSWVLVSLTAADDAIVSLGDSFLVDCSSLTIFGLAWTGTGVELAIETGSPNDKVGDG